MEDQSADPMSSSKLILDSAHNRHGSTRLCVGFPSPQPGMMNPWHQAPAPPPARAPRSAALVPEARAKLFSLELFRRRDTLEDIRRLLSQLYDLHVDEWLEARHTAGAAAAGLQRVQAPPAMRANDARC